MLRWCILRLRPLLSDHGRSVSSVAGIINQTGPNCPGKRFYTRRAFLDASRSYTKFSTTGSETTRKREIVAFFAHVMHEAGHLCYIEEIGGASRSFCDVSNKRYPCVLGKSYYNVELQLQPSRGEHRFDGLRAPERVARDPVISFKTAFWF
ncbi:Chitinase 4 [Acorus calamus]|uniref:chitinase n=1 Tax=Acorus calamus TaxID=4465 RepID=A0AAV9EME9_ACOCL|nr:Chitinase 4 [Acorus calamus]